MSAVVECKSVFNITCEGNNKDCKKWLLKSAVVLQVVVEYVICRKCKTEKNRIINTSQKSIVVTVLSKQIVYSENIVIVVKAW